MYPFDICNNFIDFDNFDYLIVSAQYYNFRNRFNPQAFQSFSDIFQILDHLKINLTIVTQCGILAVIYFFLHLT